MTDSLYALNTSFNDALFDITTFRQQLKSGTDAVSTFRKALSDAQQRLDEQYKNNVDI